ncbi:hypothetical protein M422DRAFT_253163 [Sphaerobolus stellatus SS14]|uniref:Cytochrome P450 n=1 Tax=Sphaerobolus stellatus (strain SS14) TaxID=990650 RepID=A0A0C9VYM9_SPHS4|nr:hypothetical protein M422DRAFT_253163 [Sphaerobolus stellatus SS14]
MSSLYFLGGCIVFGILLIRTLLRRIRHRSLDYLPGPPPRSWLVGNFAELVSPKEIGDADAKWTKEYGVALRIGMTFGRDMLFTSDPKALQYILNTSGYRYPKPADVLVMQELVTGPGLAWAEGAQHARQRKLMNPAFSFSALRVFVPLFRETVRRAVDRIKETHFTEQSSTVMNFMPWLSRTTLDAIGEAGFGYQFHAIDKGNDSELARAYYNLSTDINLDRPDISIAFESLIAYLPSWLIHLAFRIPSPRLKRLREYMAIAKQLAQQIVEKETSLYLSGKEGSKDVLSILIRANLSEDPKTKLSHEEVLAQMTTIWFAGHDTTSLTVSWILYQLSRHREYQSLIREEIKAIRERATERGDLELTIGDMDAMKYMLAAMKETLRFHPIVNGLMRVAGRDDVIPISIPQKTKSGTTVTSIPISKGQMIIASIFAYNRLPEVWGPDADQWRPERFLEGIESSQKIHLGVTADLATFSSGLRSCIGWRFSVLEMQAILIELLENFEFGPSPANEEIILGPAGLMTPMVKNSKDRKANLPLTVTAL